MSRLTDADVRKLPAPETGNKITYEGGGFGVRVTAAGAKSFVLTYRVDGRQRRITIGPYPAWSVKAARDRAAELRLAADKGEDPLAERQRRRGADTIGELAERYIEEHAKPNKRSWKEDDRRMEKYVLPVWRHRKVEDIRRGDVRELVAKIARTAPVEANRVLALVRKMFSFALDEEKIDTHPCLRMQVTAEVPRDRTLETEAELRAVWEITSGGEWATIVPPRQAAAIRLLLLLGQRNSEVAGMRWEEVDLEAGEWTIPRARFKGKRDHLVPLPPEALAIIKAQPDKGEYVFTGARGGPLTKKHIGNALSAACERLTADRGIERFTAHDLRRSVETGLAALGVSKEVRDRVLGHKDGSVGGRHYNRHDYKDSKRRALQAWEKRVLAIAKGTGDNVIKFPVAGGA